MSSTTTLVGAFPLKLVVVALLAAVTLLLIGARPHEAPATASISQPPEVRTAAEREWNEQEDLKVSRSMGQPGIY